MSVTDYPDWGAPQADATANAITGIPLLRLTSTLGTAASQVIGAAATVTLLSAVPISQPGYEGLFSYSLPAGAGISPFATIAFTWGDSASGLIVDAESFIITAGNGLANALTFYMSGPCRGDTLTVVITNTDGTQPGTLTWAVNQTSHVWLHDRIMQSAYAGTAPIGFTNPAGTPALGTLLVAKPTLAASGSASRLMAAFNGRVWVSVDDGAQANGVNVTFQDPGVLYSTIANANFDLIPTAAGLRSITQVQLPNGPVLVVITNIAGVNSITPTVVIKKNEKS